METVFFYLKLFVIVAETIISSKIRFHYCSRNYGTSRKIISTRRKKNYQWHESLKIENKMLSASQKISCPLAIISSFFKNCFPLIPIMANGFHEQKNSSDKKNTVSNTVRVRVGLGWRFVEKSASTTRKSYVHFKKSGLN